MPEINLAAETGRTIGSRPTGRLRRDGKIPAVVYGHGIDPLSVAVDARDLRTALNTEAGVNALLTLKVDGTDHLTMARSIQRHPVRHNVTHVDFLIVRRDEVVTVEVPIALVGDAKAVHNADGVVSQEVFSLTVNATPGNIPSSIEIDVSELAIGDAVRVGDLRLPEGVTTDLAVDEALVIGQPPQVSELDLITEADAEALTELVEAQAAEAEAAAEAGEAPPAPAESAGEPETPTEQ